MALLMGLSVLALAPSAQADHLDGTGTATDVETGRLSGGDRAGTAAEIAREVYGDTGADTAIVTRFDHEIDALASGYLAGCLGAPILLTWTEPRTVGGTTFDIHPDTEAALEDLDVENVIILGGTAAISAEVAAALDADYNTERVSGPFREDTAQEIAEYDGEFAPEGGCPVGTTQLEGDTEEQNTAILARRDTARPESDSSIDALSSGSIAFAGNHPILLTGPDALSDQAEEGLANLDIDRVIIVGGTAAISDAVKDELEAADYDVLRLSGGPGTGRWETAIAVADFAVENLGFDRSEIGLARSEHPGDLNVSSPDSMTSAAYTGTNGVPLLLVNTLSGGSIHPATQAYLAEHCEEIVALTVFGGTAAVSAAVLAAAVAAANCEDEVDVVATFTNAPELISAAFGPRSATQFTVDYTFDEPIVAGLLDDEQFHIYGPVTDTQRATSTSAERINSTTVRALFDFAGDVEEWPTTAAELDWATTATVEHTTVEDADGNSNPEGAVGLNAFSTEGRTQTADLLAALVETREATAEEDPLPGVVEGEEYTVVAYVFDEGPVTVFDPVAPGVSVAADFRVVYQDTATEADEEGAIVAIDRGASSAVPENVVVAYFDSDVVDAAEVRRAVVGEDGINEADFLQSVNVADGGATTNPDLIEVNVNIEDDEIEFVFSAPVQDATGGTPEDNFFVYYLDGSVTGAIDASFDGTATVVVEFDDGAINEAVTGAWVESGTVQDIQNRENLAGELGIATSFGTRQVVAPVLVDVVAEATLHPITGDPETLTVTFVFDKPVDDTIGAGDFALYDEDADRTVITGDCDADEGAANEVVCDIDVTVAADVEVVEEATGGGVEYDAVVNDADDRNVDGRELHNYEESEPLRWAS